MKKNIIIVVLMGSMLMLSNGVAAAFPHLSQNEFMTADTLDPGMTQTGIQFSLGDHFKSYYPEMRYGMGALMEVGVKFGAATVSTESDKVGGLVGVDLKYQLVKETEGIPLDLSVDLGIDNTLINWCNATEVSFATIVSRGFPMTDRGYKLIPYGGLVMSTQRGALPDNDATYTNLFAGLEWKLTQKFMVLLEFKGGDRAVGGAGVRFEY